MSTEDRDQKIQLLDRLADQADALFQHGKGPESLEFIAWHAEVIEALQIATGKDSQASRDFKALLFELPSEATEAFKRMRQKVRLISRTEDDVINLETLQQAIDRSKKRMKSEGVTLPNFQFENALAEAKAILYWVQIKLRDKQ